MRAHLLPSLACSSRMRRSSWGEKAPFLRFGRRWFDHRSRQLLPQRRSPVFFWTEFQFPSPFLFTYSTSIASSLAVHRPFLKGFPPAPPLIPDSPLKKRKEIRNWTHGFDSMARVRRGYIAHGRRTKFRLFASTFRGAHAKTCLNYYSTERWSLLIWTGPGKERFLLWIDFHILIALINN